MSEISGDTETASNGALTYTHELTDMDALTFTLIFLTIFFAAVYWIAWKQELRDRDRAKQRKEQKL